MITLPAGRQLLLAPRQGMANGRRTAPGITMGHVIEPAAGPAGSWWRRAGRGIVSPADRPVDSPVSGPDDASADPGLGHDGAGLERVAVADYQVGGLAWGEASGAGSVK